MSYQQIFERLWEDYSTRNPNARRIHTLLANAGENVINDHVAIRTFNDKRVNIDVLSKPFLDNGYVEKGVYDFPVKKLDAKHFEHESDISAPKVFISELRTEEFSEILQAESKKVIDQIPKDLLNNPELLLFSKRPWPAVSYDLYEKIFKESEYAAWLLAYGYGANHFTVNVNALKKYDTLEKLNKFIEDHGYVLNDSGGKIKGTPEVLLEQSSTMAEKHLLEFADGKHEVTTCYYEFAKRYKQPDGKFYQGFVASSADKLFESTNK